MQPSLDRCRELSREHVRHRTGRFLPRSDGQSNPRSRPTGLRTRDRQREGCDRFGGGPESAPASTSVGYLDPALVASNFVNNLRPALGSSSWSAAVMRLAAAGRNGSISEAIVPQASLSSYRI